MEHFVAKNKGYKTAKVRECAAQFLYHFQKGIIEGILRNQKPESFSFYEKNGEIFKKDANGAVRNWGKKILENLQVLK